jgi:hypothetical protein
METIFVEIEHAIAAGLHYSAIAMSLTIPDLCAALESSDGRTSSERYKRWYNEHFAPAYASLTADDCYSLRCGVVHQGRMGLPAGQQFARVIFVVGAPGVHQNIINDSLQLSAETFCADMVAAARRWFANGQGTECIVKNLPRLVHLHPTGLLPYIRGYPVIA